MSESMWHMSGKPLFLIVSLNFSKGTVSSPLIIFDRSSLSVKSLFESYSTSVPIVCINYGRKNSSVVSTPLTAIKFGGGAAFPLGTSILASHLTFPFSSRVEVPSKLEMDEVIVTLLFSMDGRCYLSVASICFAKSAKSFC